MQFLVLDRGRPARPAQPLTDSVEPERRLQMLASTAPKASSTAPYRSDRSTVVNRNISGGTLRTPVALPHRLVGIPITTVEGGTEIA